ncbi:MAG: ABC transporter substrate-binding protein [Alphaproteobacteria bacterium]|nr:ABC transporter substrate-binding protein [Alphaproteobacteria bacterium]
MRAFQHRLLLSGTLAASAALAFASVAGAAETPVRGGILDFVVGSTIPSYDGHQETTFGMIHPIAPFYSLLIRINPENPQSTTDFICDLCEGKWEEAADRKSYTFKIRENVKFHDGTPLTAADLKATLDKIIFPPEGIPSSRKAWYSQVEAVEAPEKYKLVVKLKRPLPAIIPALASPFNFVYSKNDLDKHGYDWHKSHINGTGAFRFVQQQPGAFVEGKRNEDYFVAGRPYLDGFKAIQAPKMSVRLQAIRGDRAAAEFRGFPPKARDDLVAAMGDRIKVQESDWNVIMGVTPNQKKKQFQDVRVRKALAHALDRQGTIKHLSKIAIVKTIGGIVFPGHRLEGKKEWLAKLPGYGNDIKAARAEAKKLLTEAGQPSLKVTLWNRAVDQPYKVVGTWFVDQWRKVGMQADQSVVPSGPWFAGLRKTKDFDVSIDFNAQTVINPTIDVSKWICDAGNNYSNCQDKKASDLYFAMLYESDPELQYDKMRAYEKHIIGDTAQYIPAFWWYKINPHRTYMKGWKIAPSHYLNQQLDTVWIDPKLR